jgi:3-hydroxyacyl-CoA dehydrogenase/enoyl-CoA hydratase/3-hydroxybutyryl-CoA epimerase
MPDHPATKVIERMLELGRPGRLRGAGFYEYEEGKRTRLWPGLRDEFPVTGDPSSIDLRDLEERMLFAEALETVKCFDEGVLTSVADANIGSIFGIGFPAWTGGAIQFIASEGKERFLSNAAVLAKRHGDRFAISEATLNAALSPHASS